MILDVTIKMLNVDGEVLQEPDEKGEVRDVILRSILVNALMIPAKDDTGEQKVEKYILAMDIQKNDEVEITPEKAVLLKKVVGPNYGPVVVGPIFALLDGGE